MKRTHLIAVVVGFMASVMLAQDAFGRARMYNPRLGRFMQRDPVGTPLAPALGQSDGVIARNISAPQYTRRDVSPTQQYVDGMNLYQYVRSNPAVTVDPFGLVTTRPSTQPSGGNPSLFNPCGCRVYRKEIDWSKLRKTKDPEIGNDEYEAFIGHTWIQCGSDIYDFPQGFQDDRNEEPDWIWGTTRGIFGKLQAGSGSGKSCACASCDDIKSCLQAVENQYASCGYSDDGLGIFPPKDNKWNCRVHALKSLSSCCLSQNLFPDKAFGIGPDKPLFAR